MFKTLSIAAVVLSYLMAMYMLPKWISRANTHGLYGQDKHKKDRNKVAEAGGIVVILSAAIGLLFYIAMLVFYYQDSRPVPLILAALCTIFLALIIGFVDDILGWKIGLKQRDKIILSFLIPLPLMVINACHHTMYITLLGKIDFGILYPLFIIPIAVVGASNAFNMLAGYNGLEAGMGSIILFALGLMLWLSGTYWVAIIALCVLGALIAFISFNWYPAKVFPGDTMTYTIGATIAIIAILGNMERFALLLFPLYFLEFLLKARGKMKKQSFAKVEKDGTLSVKEGWYTIPHIMIDVLKKLKIRSTEQNVVASILLMQLGITAVTFFYYFYF